MTSCNLNKLYTDFIPIFVRSWKKLIPEIKIVIVLISDKIPDEYLEYSEHIRLFQPITGVSDSFISQYIRNLYPCILNSNGGVLITDMDMLPLNSNFYLENIEKYDNKFIYYRGNLKLHNEYSMCYNVALSETWKDIFKIEEEDDITNRLKEVFSSLRHSEGHGAEGWNKDQLDLYTYINKWDKKEESFITLSDRRTGFQRLCRSRFSILNRKIERSIIKGKFSDYHALRPYMKYKETNDRIIDLI